MSGTQRSGRGPWLVPVVLAMPLLAACAAAPGAGTAAAGDDLAREQSVKPGINERWKSTDIQPLIGILESESREIYANRVALAAVAGPRRGSVVADLGAGSGFMTEQFARLVGPQGTVYAVDINPVMMDHVQREAQRRGVGNIRTVVCDEKSVALPPASVDMVFICDTYHHFEYPRHTLRSIHEALRPGGQIVLVDFRRIPGTSRPFILEHVRAGEEQVAREVAAAGFQLINEHQLPFLQENYVLRFRRIDGGG